MGLIALEGMQFYAYHGFYEEENIIGNDYIIDLYVETNFNKAMKTDELPYTINYETIYLICKTEMKKPQKLLETIAANILDRLKYQFQTIQGTRIVIKKLNPPLGGQVSHSMIEIEKNFVSKCGRCGSSFVCYKDENCWCQGIQLTSETQYSLDQRYKGCLCSSCLGLFAGK